MQTGITRSSDDRPQPSDGKVLPDHEVLYPEWKNAEVRPMGVV